MTVIKQALISVSDKSGVVGFARGLTSFGVKILSTGGTAKLLHDAGIAVTEVADHTGFPEMLDGRVKTLHPNIHGGILARRELPAHLAALMANGITVIDLVVVNLYPFAATVARPGCTFEEAIENIDIGGPAMLRSAAKNHAHVGVVTDPQDYAPVLEEMRKAAGALGPATRFRLAQKAFSHTAAYDAAISNYLTAVDALGARTAFPGRLNLNFDLVQSLRYGENPHQQAAFYRDPVPAPGNLSNFRQVQGKELSYNNIADADCAWECVKSFEQTACVIVKHANPCGVAVAQDTLSAYQHALATDPVSAFGGIIAFNRELDADTARAVIELFVEVLIAPAISAAAIRLLGAKQNIRVLEIPLSSAGNPPSPLIPLPGTRDRAPSPPTPLRGGEGSVEARIRADSDREGSVVNASHWEYKRIGGGLLVQTPDSVNVSAAQLRCVTKRAPSVRELDDLLFAWRVAKFVKSNAIVFCGGGRTLGVGAGQMSRVDSARIASIKAQAASLSLAGSVVASDAFFPFRDGIDVVARSGARAVIQPGGSVRDEEVIAAADEQDLAMMFTGVRHFRH